MNLDDVLSVRIATGTREIKSKGHIPLDEVFEVLLDQHSEFVLDLGDILCVCWAPVGDLVVLESFVALIITRRAVTLRRRTAGSASQ